MADWQAVGLDEVIVPDFTLGRGARKLERMDALIEQVRPSSADRASSGRDQGEDGGEDDDAERHEHGDGVTGVVRVEVGGVVHQVGQRRRGAPPRPVTAGQQRAARDEGHHGDEGQGQVEAADVADEVLVVRAVDRHPRPAHAGEVVVERPGEALRPQPHDAGCPRR